MKLGFSHEVSYIIFWPGVGHNRPCDAGIFLAVRAKVLIVDASNYLSGVFILVILEM